MKLQILKQKQEAEFDKYCSILENPLHSYKEMEEVYHFLSKIRQESIEYERERIIKLINELKTDERKVAIFGKGMDSWEARNYDEKQLVNAVLKDLLKIV